MLKIEDKEILNFTQNQNFVRMAESLRDSQAVDALEIYQNEDQDYELKAVITDHRQFMLFMKLSMDGEVLDFHCNNYVFRPERVMHCCFC